jgi:glycerol-3-phosphate dehydrogenase
MKHFDIAILGGGIAGLGVADACAQRGLAVVALEAHTLAHAASNNTLRIIHGGFRYLQQANLVRVVRSLNDQSYVVRSFPEAVKPLPCLMPLARTGLKSRWPVTAAALMYGAVMRTCRSSLPSPTVLSAGEVQGLAPELAALAPRGALCWHDVVMTDPSRIHADLQTKLLSKGVEFREHTRVVAVERDPSGFRILCDNAPEVKAKKVVNTLGAWLGSIAVPDSLQGPRPAWCLGFNIIISKQLHPTHACAVQSSDGRLFFCVPRGSRTAIGTWYVPYGQSLPPHTEGTKPPVPEHDISDFIASFNRAFPSFQIHANDICDIDVGILPMKKEGLCGPELYGSEIISSTIGYCEVISTKYTTFRSQGQRALQAIRTES